MLVFEDFEDLQRTCAHTKYHYMRILLNNFTKGLFLNRKLRFHKDEVVPLRNQVKKSLCTFHIMYEIQVFKIFLFFFPKY